MSKLSPQVQAVLDAYRSSHLSIDNLAAALRAAADQAVSPVPPPCEDFDEYAQGFLAAHAKCRSELLAIAAELRGDTTNQEDDRA